MALADDTGTAAVKIALSELADENEIVEELEGGASTRQFFRVRFDGRNAIAMYTPAPSQEIAKARQTSGYGAFVEVAGLLADHDLPVPRIFAASPTQPVLFVEDLGDFTLAAYVAAHPESKERLYRSAVAALARGQNQLSPLPARSVIRTRAFDYDLLLWEVEHFRTWALSERGVDLTPAQQGVFERCASYLSRTISDWDRGFVHRDYQSRNIMVRGSFGRETLTWIDFQDAMLGPRVYDLVALLTDSYQTFSQEFVRARLDEYCAIRGFEEQRARIDEEFSLVTVQRKLKDAGRFVFLDRVNGNPHFLKFVESTVDKARRALRSVRHLGSLSELDDLLSELFGPLRDD